MDIVTKKGYEKLNNELEKLKDEELPKVSADLKEAIAQGDISENAAYDEARDRKAEIENRIKEIEKRLSRSAIAEEVSHGGEISVGKSFSVRDEVGTVREFSIVGSEDAMPLEGKISFDSPLGQAFLNRKEGDVVDVTTPAGEKKYKVIKVH